MKKNLQLFLSLFLTSPLFFQPAWGSQGRDLNLMSEASILSPVFLGEHPTVDSLNSIKESQLGLFSENGKLYCKVFGKDSTEIIVDEDAVEATQRGLPRRIFDKIMGAVTDKIKDVGALGFATQMGNAPIAGKHYNDAYESISELEWSSLCQFMSLNGYVPNIVQSLNNTTSIGGRTRSQPDLDLAYNENTKKSPCSPPLEKAHKNLKGSGRVSFQNQSSLESYFKDDSYTLEDQKVIEVIKKKKSYVPLRTCLNEFA